MIKNHKLEEEEYNLIYLKKLERKVLFVFWQKIKFQKKSHQEVNIDKILDNYSEFKELSKPENDLINSKSNSL